MARLQMHKMATGAAGEGDPEILGLRQSHCAEGCLLSGCCDLWQTPPPLSSVGCSACVPSCGLLYDEIINLLGVQCHQSRRHPGRPSLRRISAASSSRKGFRILRQQTWVGMTSSSLTTALEVSVGYMLQMHRHLLSATSTGRWALASMSTLRQTRPSAATQPLWDVVAGRDFLQAALVFIACAQRAAWATRRPGRSCSPSCVCSCGHVARATWPPVVTLVWNVLP